MRSSLRHGALALALLGSVGLVAAADEADTGKINRGATETQRPPVEAPSAPTSAGTAAPSDNMGAAESGPIGATPQTMPSKYSADNAAADKRPIMAHPLVLTDAQKRQIYDGVAVNQDAVVRSIDAGLATALPSDVTLYELPNSVTETIPAVRGYKYVKLEDKVLLIDPPNRIVVGEITK